MSQGLEPPYRLIRNGLNEGRVIPFLGSGASLGRRLPPAAEGGGDASVAAAVALCLPTSVELAGLLAKETEFPEDEPLDLAKVAQYYNVVGGRGPLHRALRQIFNRDYPLTALHTFLASVDAPLLIVTTNYDDLIERAFTAQGREYDVVIHVGNKRSDNLLWWRHGASVPEEVSPNKLDIDLGATTVIYKMHGAVDRSESARDQYVITEDDYIDFLVRMTRNKAIPSIFANPFQTRHFLFCGYGLRDWNLRVVLNRIEKDLKRPREIKSWAIDYRTRPLERRFWQERHVEVFDMQLDDFVRELAAR